MCSKAITPSARRILRGAQVPESLTIVLIFRRKFRHVWTAQFYPSGDDFRAQPIGFQVAERADGVVLMTI